MYVLAKSLHILTAVCVKSIPGCDYINNHSIDMLLHIIAQVCVIKIGALQMRHSITS